MNSHRGIFAEFIVATTLGVVNTKRVEWDVADIIYQGYSIEVKSSAFVQSWEQPKLSTPSFDISKKRIFGQDEESRKRHADFYVFCLLNEKDKQKLDPLNLEQWKFYIISTKFIDDYFGEQKRVSLNRIRSVIEPVDFRKIKSTIDLLINIA